CARKQSNFDFW
nr:immunoglobulin heavy chain junction region [Macaca mulatta]